MGIPSTGARYLGINATACPKRKLILSDPHHALMTNSNLLADRRPPPLLRARGDGDAAAPPVVGVRIRIAVALVFFLKEQIRYD
jgi:hypothetical protein